jgi:hypothetical protein
MRMKNEFIGGFPGKLERLEKQGQKVFDFEGKEKKESRNFLNYTREQKDTLRDSIEEKYKKNHPPNEEETDFESWLETDEGRKNG